MKSKNSKGFTLVELLIFTAVTGIVAVVLFSVLISFLKSRNTAKRLSLLQDVATYIFNDLTQEIHWSNEVEKPTSEEPTSDELSLVQGENIIAFTVNGAGQFLKSGQPLSPAEVIVGSFTVTDHAPGEDQISLLEIQLELEYKDSNPRIISTHGTTISLRKTALESFQE